MGKKIYLGFSFWEFLKTLFYKLLLVFGGVYSYAHYDENPQVVSAVMALCLLLILSIGTDQIIVYDDRITQRTDSFLALIFKRKGITYFLKDIKSAHLEPPSDPSEIAVMSALYMIFPRSRSREIMHPIFLELKEGKTVQFQTELGQDQREKIVSLVNSQIK